MIVKVPAASAASPGWPPNLQACTVAAHAGYAPARQASFQQATEDMQPSTAHVRLTGVLQRTRLPRRAQLATGACQAIRVDEEVRVYGFNEKVSMGILLCDSPLFFDTRVWW